MMTFDERLAEQWHYSATYTVHGCPLCRVIHPVCAFKAGSLFCRLTRCGNPHHRRRNILVAPL